MSGSTVHDGLEYQALVSALAAVELVIVQGYAGQLLIEPPSHEDLEGGVERILEEAEPAPGESRSPTETTTEAYTIAIQSKRRDNGVWTAPQVDALLRHGKARMPARERLLADRDVRYLLATSGTLIAEAATLRVDRFGEWPDAAAVEPRFAALNIADRCRVGVMDGLTEAAISYRLDNALRTSLYVPFDRVADCIDALADEARKRGSSAHSGAWTAAEIGETLKAHEALLPGELDHGDYVEPRNYPDLQGTLRSQQAVLILGPSGTGKTRTALQLRDELRAELDGARTVTILPASGPGRITAELQSLPAILYLEDPWGPVALADHAAAWTKALADAAVNRRRGGWLIITSRSDVYRDAGIPQDDFSSWKVTLDAGQYGERERRRLLEIGLKALPFRIRAIAEPHLDRAVATLTTPLEIKTYISGLAPGPAEGEAGPSLVVRAIAAANSKLYKDVVAAQVADRRDEAAAAVLWLLFSGERTLTLDSLMQARRAMTRVHGSAPPLENLVNFLRAGHSLDQEQDRYAYAHPQVEAGLATAALRDLATFEAAGKALIEALAAPSASADAGPLLAARILANLTAGRPALAQGLVQVLSIGARSAIEAHLLAALNNLTASTFADVFLIAGRIGSAGCLHFELARWMTDAAPIAADADLEGMIPRWAAAQPDPSWASRIAADPSAISLLEKAVEQLAAREQEFYPNDFAEHLAPLDVDLSPAFGRVALTLVPYGHDNSVTRVINGARVRLETLEPAVRAAQAIYAADQPLHRHDWRLQLANGVFDAEHAENLSAGDEGHWCAGEITQAWVRAKRAKEGWRALAAFPDIHLLAWDWKQAIDHGESPVDLAEFEALAAAARGHRSEIAVWELAAETAAPSLAAPIAARLQAGDMTEGVRGALRRAQAIHDLPALITEQDRLVARQDVGAALMLHRDLLPAPFAAPNPALPATRTQLKAALPGNLQDLADAAVADLTEVRPDPTSPVGAAAARMVTDDPALASRLIRLTDGRHPAFDRLYAAAVDGWTPTDDEDAQAALDAAIALDRTDLVRAALEHPRGSVAARAITQLGDQLTLAELVGLPGQEGHIVRQAIVAALGHHAGGAAQEALLRFCDDAYNGAYNGELTVNPVARQAATLLAERPTWSAGLVDAVKARAATHADAAVAYTLIKRLGAGATADRHWLMDTVADDRRGSALRFSAARALLANVAAYANDGLPTPPADLLMTAPGGTAVVLARFVSVLLSEADALQLAIRLWTNPDRRALALLLGRPERPTLNGQLAALLPPDHPAAALVGSTPDLIRRDSLDDLAEPAVVRTMLNLLSKRFEPVPQMTFRSRPARAG